MRITVATLLIAAGIASAAPADTACQNLSKALPSKVVLKGTKDYTDETADYWSKACRSDQPSCIVFATSAQDVSTSLKILKPLTDVKFTVKSGGHDPNCGHSSINGGILISLNKSKGATYDPATKLAKVRPGGAWTDPIGDLLPKGVTMVGGRLSVVGVAGLLTGGGFSFLTSQHGMAADSITEFETVFPNGTIARVNRANNPVLFRAMKGSNNNFGIVTEFTVKTYPMGQVWGGQRIYLGGQLQKILEAQQDFTNNYPDPKSSIIVTIQQIPGGSTAVIIFFFYHGSTPPKGAFGKFEQLSPLYDGCKAQDYVSLLKSNGDASAGLPFRSSFRTLTLPTNADDDGALLKASVDLWISSYANVGSTVQPTLAFQPFPSMVGKASEASGGNAMGLSANDGNRVILEFATLWLLESSDDIVQAAGRNMTQQILASYKQALAKKGLKDTTTQLGTNTDTKLYQGQSSVKVWGTGAASAAGGALSGMFGKLFGRQIPTGTAKVDTYNPLFLNDANQDQEVFKTYKEYNTFAALQKQIDPDGFFATRIGGFKY